MDPRRTDQQSPQATCLPIQDQEQEPVFMQRMGEQAPSSPPQQIRDSTAGAERAGTDRHDTHRVSWIQLPEDHHAPESDSNITAPSPCSPAWPQPVTTLEQAQQPPSRTPSVHTRSDHSDLSAAVTPTPSDPTLVSSNSTLQCPPPLRISESLGLEGCAGIIGGFVGILGVIGFLTFLWFGAGSALEAANATWVWRQLAMRNWMPRAVTLTSIVLRFIIGVQATVCTSMVAALLLERLSVPRSQAAHASIMRGINDGPWKLLMLVLSYKARVSQILWHLEAWLILLVALLSLALQFTSTILLSDMHSFIMIGDLNTTTANSLFAFPEREEFALFAGDLMATIPVYPVFGEVPTTHDSSPDSRGFSDTGLQQRGLLPMPGSDTRTSVREYDGMGMVMSSRVACMRPVITNASITNVSLDLIDHIYGRLEGVLEFGQALDEARPGTGSSCDSSEECERLAFDCSIPAAYNATELWAPGACVIDGVGGNIRSSAQPTWDPAGGPWSENSSVWLLYSTDLEDEEWESLPPDGSMPPGQPVGDSEWTIYEVVPGHFIKLSACFSDFNFAHRDIRMTAAGATTERSTPWSLLLSKDFKMDEVETYLGLNPSHQAIADRGVLDLQIKPDDNAPYIPPPPYEELLDLPDDEITPTALTVNSIQLETIFGLTNGITKNTTFTLCGRCTIDAITVHMDYASLFSSVVLGETTGGEGRAADALHAFISLVGFNIYDQFLAGTMDVAEEVRLVTTLEVTVPGSWPPTRAACAGFIAVVSLLVAYLALVAGITVLYVRHTRYSRYGNVWHVISQLVASEELGETLELGNNASDKSVVKDLRTKGSSKDASDVVLVKLGKADGCENIKVSKFGT